MEKILLAVDAINPDTQALDFACYLGALTRSKVTGVFLGNLEDDERLVFQDAVYDSGHSSLKSDKGSKDYLKKNEILKKNIAGFNDACDRRSARHSVHIAGGDPAKEIIRESRYADILVVDADTSFRKKFEGTPSTFVKDVLSDVECPVIIAPESFEGIEEIVFTYDGSKSSMFAIKQFCYLFPKLDDKKVTLLQVDEENLCSAEEREHLKEWISSHYSSIGFETLKGDAKTALLSSLLKKKNVFIVMGAYGRNTLSRFFQGSHADILIKTLNRAIFIAHC